MLAALPVAVSGCDILPDPEFAALEKALTLNVVHAARHASGDQVDFSFALTNRSRTTAMACLGPDRTVSFRVGSSVGARGSYVDHPGCVREFTIQGENVMSWTETLEVSDLSKRRADVEVSVQIVNPRRCSGGSCASFELKSNRFEIP